MKIKSGYLLTLDRFCFLQDGTHNRRGFPSHILPAFGESMVKRDGGYNAEQNAVLLHLGVTPPNFREHQHELLGGATASVS